MNKRETGELPYASNKEIADEKIGKWLSAALEDPTTCGAMKDDINEWFRAVEEERLRRIPLNKEPMCDEQGNSYIKIVCPNGETVYCPKNKHKQVEEDLENGIYPVVSPDNIVVALGQTMSNKLTDEEIEELRAKKQAIKEELYEAVKMEMFKASSALEGIEYEHQVEGWDIKNPKELQELLEHMIQRINLLEDGE